VDTARARDLLFADVAVALGAAEPTRLARSIEAFWQRSDGAGLADALEREGVLDAIAREAVEREVGRIVEQTGGDAAAAVERRGGIGHELRESFSPGVAEALGVRGRAPLRGVAPGRYKDFEVIGRGGMGLVYLALDTEMNRRVAFKMVRPDPSAPKDAAAPEAPLQATPPTSAEESSRAYEELTVRFLQEAWVTGAMEHPGIVPVYELGRTDAGIPYYTMRCVRGARTLQTAIREAEGLDARLALLEPFLKVCDTIAYAHARGIVHRDLKPENIALGEFGEAVVLDWGLAKARGQPDVSAGAWRARVDELRAATDLRTVAGAMGTAGYISPEAALGKGDEVDERSDVYSLGAILFEILTGRLPFRFKSFVEYVQQMLEEEPPRADGIDEGIPEELSELCARMLARKPEERPASAAELSQALRRWQTEGRLEQQANELLEHARAEIEAARRGTGNTSPWHLDRASAACSKALHLRSVSPEALAVEAEIKELREHGIRERERATSRRTVVAAGFVVLVLASFVALYFARHLSDARAEAEMRLGQARSEVALREAEARTARTDAADARARRAEVYTTLSSSYLKRGDPAAARLAAAMALKVSPSLDAWRALAQAEAQWTPTIHAMERVPGAGPLAFGPDGRLYVAAGAQVIVKQGGRGDPVLAISAFEPVHLLAISPDGERIAAAGKIVRVLSAKDGSLLAKLPDDTRTSAEEIGIASDALRPTALAFDTTGRRLFVGYEKGMILDWDVEGRSLMGVREAQDTAVTALVWDGEFLLAGDAGGSVVRLVAGRFDHSDARVFGVTPVVQILPADEGVVRAVTLGHRIAMAEFSVKTHLEGSFRVLTEFEAPAGRARMLLVSPDRARLFSVPAVGGLVAWDVERRRELARLLPEGTDPTGLAIAPDGSLLAVATADDTVRVYALDMCWPPEGPEPSSAFATSADGARTVLARPDRTLEAWDAAEGRRIARVPTGAATASAVAIEGDRVLLASLDGTISIWSLGNGTLTAEASLKGPEKTVTAITPGATPDEIVLGLLDGTVEIWSAKNRRRIARLDEDGGPPVVALRAADGRIDVWDVTGHARSWSAASREPVSPSPADPPTPSFPGRAPPHQSPALPWVARDPTWRLIDFENRYGRKLLGAEVVPIPVENYDPLRLRIDPLSK
jgi:serine/threonine protein kinase/WD40 repeat protein